MTEPRAFLPTFFRVAAKNLHVIVGAAADDELGLVPVAAEDSVWMSGEVVERSSVGPDVPHLDQRIVRAGHEQVRSLGPAAPVNASDPALKLVK